MSLKGRAREIQLLIEKAGLEIDPQHPITNTGGTHFKVWVRRPGEESTAFFFFSRVPSDWRGDNNKLSELKRFLRGGLDPKFNHQRKKKKAE